MGLFRKKDKEMQTKLQDIEPKLAKLAGELNQIATQLSFLESNFRIFSKKFNTKLGRLPTEEKQSSMSDIEKDFYKGVLLPE